MDLRLQDKTALITGGSAGIGKGIALGLAQEGCHMAICARRPALLEATAAELRQATGRQIWPSPPTSRNRLTPSTSYTPRCARSGGSTFW